MGCPNKIIFTAALISSANNLSGQEKAQNTKPNIVVFLADDAGMGIKISQLQISTKLHKMAFSLKMRSSQPRNQARLVPVCLAENSHIRSGLKTCTTD